MSKRDQADCADQRIETAPTSSPELIAMADEMLHEATLLVHAASEEGILLRLIGGVAVRALLAPYVPASRPLRDTDLVGRRRQTRRIAAFFRTRGFQENVVFRLNSGGRLMQFFRACRHLTTHGPAHPDDRVDVYLDAYRLEHDLPLADRLADTQLTVPAGDVLLAKLLRTTPSAYDIDDAVALLRILPVTADGGPDGIDPSEIAARCARDWGLHHDVLSNLRRCRRVADARNDAAVLEAVSILERSLSEHPKSFQWRLRAPFGERLPWSDAVEERDGRRFSAREHEQ